MNGEYDEINIFNAYQSCRRCSELYRDHIQDSLVSIHQRRCRRLIRLVGNAARNAARIWIAFRHECNKGTPYVTVATEIFQLAANQIGALNTSIRLACGYIYIR